MGQCPFNVINAMEFMKVFFLFVDAVNPVQSLHLGQD